MEMLTKNLLWSLLNVIPFESLVASGTKYPEKIQEAEHILKVLETAGETAEDTITLVKNSIGQLDKFESLMKALTTVRRLGQSAPMISDLTKYMSWLKDDASKGATSQTLGKATGFKSALEIYRKAMKNNSNLDSVADKYQDVPTLGRGVGFSYSQAASDTKDLLSLYLTYAGLNAKDISEDTKTLLGVSLVNDAANSHLFLARAVDEYVNKPDDFSAQFVLEPKGVWQNLNRIFPTCEHSKIGIGHQVIVTAFGQPLVEDEGEIAVETNKGYYNDDEGEEAYTISITREEGFVTPTEQKMEFAGGGGDMILAPTFAISFTITDKLSFNLDECSADTQFAVPGWDVKTKDMDATAWHSVYHIRDIMLPDMEKLLEAEKAKADGVRDDNVVLRLQQGIRGWNDVLTLYGNLTEMALADTTDNVLPGYVSGQQDLNQLIQPGAQT
ncbi:hypothetical protein HYH03_013936 [Edaphochlamys debaryana]|uniref:Uncharacterized protein n=1 Tax=Edaphochlamys debaryana TaxID=47281 RepID=A0A835XNX0_9CHLO|nr:hypothetical protein HYH03_013936 [Edaphochlamys debaryana]|eukprot:KAG2487518.1 hypothetical protein HYH03_013936 [Edaphochlamys debaryana]